MQPFEAVDLLRQKAVSKEFPSGGAYVFYENQYGVQFRSIENIIKEDSKEPDIFVNDNMIYDDDALII